MTVLRKTVLTHSLRSLVILHQIFGDFAGTVCHFPGCAAFIQMRQLNLCLMGLAVQGVVVSMKVPEVFSSLGNTSYALTTIEQIPSLVPPCSKPWCMVSPG